MERAAYFSGPIVVVEALDDKKFWQAFFDPLKCRLVKTVATKRPSVCWGAKKQPWICGFQFAPLA
jgi:hypothetical protein